MKKKNLFILLIMLITITSIILTVNYNKIFKKDNNITIYVDGKLATAVPAKSEGKLASSVTCDGNVTGIFDYASWKLQLKGIESGNANFKCTVNFITDPNTPFNTYLYNNASTLGLVSENGYRYEGENPNNWIIFNNEYWRIIGRLPVLNSSGSTVYLVKLIRAEVLDSLVWNSSSSATWDGSALQLALASYYNKTDYSNCYIYNYSTTSVTKTCYFSQTGLDSTARSMVETVKWNVGNVSVSTAGTMYTNETSTSGTKWAGQVALMSASDYGYGVLASDCARTTSLSSYNTSSCAGKNWLKINGWLLTPKSSSAVHPVYNDGLLGTSGSNPTYGYDVRPSVYLKSTIQYKGGDGSHDNPFQIA